MKVRGQRFRLSAREKFAIVLRLIRGEHEKQLSDELQVPVARLEKWRKCFLLGGRVALLLLTLIPPPSNALRGLWRLLAQRLRSFQWSLLVSTLAVAITAIFTGLLYRVTSEYTSFTKAIFHSQHEKYIYDVLGNRAFEIEIVPPASPRVFDKPELQVRVKNLTALRFTEVRLEVFASVRDRNTREKRTLLVFEPSALLVEKTLEAGGMLVAQDKQNDVAFHLRENGFLAEGNALGVRFEITRFFGRAEALSPTGVLWRLQKRQRNEGSDLDRDDSDRAYDYFFRVRGEGVGNV